MYGKCTLFYEFPKTGVIYAHAQCIPGSPGGGGGGGGGGPGNDRLIHTA